MIVKWLMMAQYSTISGCRGIKGLHFKQRHLIQTPDASTQKNFIIEISDHKDIKVPKVVTNQATTKNYVMLTFPQIASGRMFNF